MTLDEAVALLREAHSFVDPTDTDLFDRISDALASHDAEPAAVEWREYGRHTEDASIDGAHCILRYVGGSTGWHWDAMRTGTTQSLYDARAAAEKAARGIR
jgi:hypothetical protein